MKEAVIDSPLFFLAFVMLTEPLTTPPTKKLQAWYGAIVGVLFAPQLHIGSVSATPELALVLGNVFSYIVSPKQKLILKLREKIALVPGVFEFAFTADQGMTFRPGQYLEWTLGHSKPDTRGNRRYFTIASAPDDADIRLGVKFNDPPSSFKKNLAEMKMGDTIVASQLGGDFTLPKNPNTKIVFIAGGIGITPFVSMVRDALHKKERRDTIILYANRSAEEIAYREIFERAREELGMKTVYTLSGERSVSASKHEYAGYITEAIIRAEIPDYLERLFYISGPNAMVVALEKLLANMSVPAGQIKVDYFPGF